MSGSALVILFYNWFDILLSKVMFSPKVPQSQKRTEFLLSYVVGICENAGYGQFCALTGI